jgi:hypothetical protein
MLYKKTNATGIDVPIQKTQTLLHDKLNVLWGINMKAYGRAYLLKKGKQVLPEVFVNNIDYEDVLGLNDNRFFFIQSNSAKRVSNTRYESDIDIYFIINLKEVKSGITHRADEEVHKDIDYILNQTDFYINSIETGIDNVINDFKLNERDNFNLADFEPYHIFKVKCTITYDLSKIECNG